MIDLDRQKRYLLACSYGPDSMALFDMLLKGKYNFSVAHVNYNLRPESKEETKSLKAFCKANNIDVYIKNNKRKITKNIEEKCREIRYQFFQKIYIDNKFDSLLIAHNQDDHIETYLLQQKRKNLVLFYGISCKSSLFSMNIIRPLLKFKKSELLEYCKNNNVPYAIDSTNLENTFLRNQIRHQIVEVMTDVERHNIIDEINKKNMSLKTILHEVDTFDSKYISDLIKVKENVFPYLINALARKIIEYVEVSSRLCNEIKKACLSDKPNVVVKIKNHFCFIKEYDEFKFDFDYPIYYEFNVNLGDIVNNEYLYFDTNIDLEKRNICESDFPLIISNLHKNDETKIKGYIVKVRRLFIDWKMPASIRKRWPIIRNNKNEIVYVPRYQKHFNKSSSKGFYVKIL